MMGQFCTWCGTTFEPEVTGRSVKRFCSKDCRQKFHAACRIWGEEAYGTGEVTVWQLQRCLGRHEHHQRDPALERVNVPETLTCTDGPLTGATLALENVP